MFELVPSHKSPGAERELGCADPGQADRGGADDDPRSQQLDGIPAVPKDLTVPEGTRRLIALAKTLVLWLILGAAGAGVFCVREHRLGEEVAHSGLGLVLTLCGASGPSLVGEGAENADGLVEMLSREGWKVFAWRPAGPEAEALALPVVKYFHSEEYHYEPPEYSAGYSFFMFRESELEFQVRLANHSNLSCLHGHGAEPAEHAVRLFGQAAVGVLHNAGRRIPRVSIPMSPVVHGSVMLRMDQLKMWSSAQGAFSEEYQPSHTMVLYEYVSIILRVLTTAFVSFILGRALLLAWLEATDVWMVQYDFLWTNPEIHSKGDGQREALLSARTTKARGGDTPLRMCACSDFLVLDHIVGNPQINDEHWFEGLGSALVIGIFQLLPSVLPVIHALFFADWMPVCLVVVLSHYVLSACFGAMYFHGVSYSARRLPCLAHLAFAGACVTYSLYYFLSALLFIATRIIVLPEEATAFVVSIGSILVYIVVVSTTLQTLRRGFIEQLSGKQKKGAIVNFLKYIALDTKSIIFTVLFGTFLLVLFASMLILACELYIEKKSMGQVLAAGATSVSAFVAAGKQLQDKRQNVDEIGQQAEVHMLAVF